MTGSDPIGGAGIQADVCTSVGMGTGVHTVVTAVRQGEDAWYDLPVPVVKAQVETVLRRYRPRVARIGLVRSAALAEALRQMLQDRCRVVCAPGILSFDGRPLLEDGEIPGIARQLVPLSTLLMLRAAEAEKLLRMTVRNDQEMLLAARLLHEQGARWVLLRGASRTDGRLSALLYGPGCQRFFSSYHDGWSGRGIGAAFSAAVAIALAAGDELPDAVAKAHDYLHAHVLYRQEDAGSPAGRTADLYDRFLSLLEQHGREQHELRAYASMLCITPRYLARVTAAAAGRTPRQVMAAFLTSKSRELLVSTRLSVQEISRRMGFSSEAVFCKFIRQQTGVSPNALRK